MQAMQLLESIFEKAWIAAGNPPEQAQHLLTNHQEKLKQLPLSAENVEHSSRRVRILHGVDAWYAYRDMLIWYGVTTLAQYFDEYQTNSSIFERFNSANGALPWLNAGGQLIRQDQLDNLRCRIGVGELTSWKDIHEEYDCLWEQYPFDRAEHAYCVLCKLANVTALNTERWQHYLDEALKLRSFIEEQILITKKKDYTNPYRDITYRNKAERDAVLGHVEQNAFVLQSAQDTQHYAELFARVRNCVL